MPDVKTELKSVVEKLDKIAGLLGKTSADTAKVSAMNMAGIGQWSAVPVPPTPMPRGPSPFEFEFDLPEPKEKEKQGQPRTAVGKDIVEKQQQLQKMFGGKGPPGRMAGMGGAIWSGAGEMIGGLKEPRVEEGLPRFIGGAGTIGGGVIGGAIGGPGGAAIGGVIGSFGGKLIEATEKLKLWTQQIHQSNMEFAEYSPSMAGVQARQLQRDIQYKFERGEARAESAEKLAEGMSELRDSLAPMEDWFANLRNDLAADMAKGAADLVKAIQGTFKWGKSEEEKKKEEKEKGQILKGEAYEGSFEQMLDQHLKNYSQQYGRPNRIPRS